MAGLRVHSSESPRLAGAIHRLDDPPQSDDQSRDAVSRRRATLALGLLVVMVAFLPRLLTAQADVITNDEPLWMVRTDGFYDALTSFDLERASAYQGGGRTVTMPGITTMWMGTAARGVWALGQGIGIWEDESPGFATSALGLDIAQVLAALVLSILLGVLVLLVVEWAGLVAGAIVGALVATEPFFVAHGAVLHTDGLLTTGGIAFLVALALVLGLPQPTRWADHRRLAVVSGVFFAVAWLSKVSAVMYLPAAAGLVLWAMRRNGGLTSRAAIRTAWRSVAATVGRVALGAVATVVVLYPAIWADPIDEGYWLARSASQGVREHTQFFLGEPTPTPGPAFYFVAIPFRVTPWFLVAAVVALTAIWRRRTRAFGAALALMALPVFAFVSLASKQFDRYSLPVLVVLAVMVGVVGSTAVDAVRSSRPKARPLLGAAAGLATFAMAIHATAVAPWGLAYFDPVVGGSDSAVDTLTVGWGEGMNEALAAVSDHAGNDCRDVTVWVMSVAVLALPYSDCQRPANATSATYTVLYVSDRQRRDLVDIEHVTAGRELVETITIRGIVYAEVYGPIDGSEDP